jgi:hypothetical protein
MSCVNARVPACGFIPVIHIPQAGAVLMNGMADGGLDAHILPQLGYDRHSVGTANTRSL